MSLITRIARRSAFSTSTLRPLTQLSPFTTSSSLRHASEINQTTDSSSSRWPKPHLIPTTGTYPRGFKAGSMASGVKKSTNKITTRDLTLIVSESPVVAAAGVFTTNAFAAAPVMVCKNLLKDFADKKVSLGGVVVNSGCANACTGEKGMEDALKMVQSFEELSSMKALIMSTGVIGQHLQMDKITLALPKLYGSLTGSHKNWLEAAEGVMTTDTFPKLRSAKFTLPESGITYTLAGFCKGAGMIHPNMATMLSCVVTDLGIAQPALESAVKYAVDRSFNAVSVDGDTSTNDSFVVLANGRASSSNSKPVQLGTKDYEAFQQQLTEFSADLAQLIVRDGEGATKFVTIRVRGANNFEDAKHVASTIATSALVKTAIYGQDANWGRIVCAVGYSGIPIEPSQVQLWMMDGKEETKLHLFKDGAPFDCNESIASQILKGEDIVVDIDLGLGSGEAAMYTCDFSTEYVHINADYRS